MNIQKALFYSLASLFFHVATASEPVVPAEACLVPITASEVIANSSEIPLLPPLPALTKLAATAALGQITDQPKEQFVELLTKVPHDLHQKFMRQYMAKAFVSKKLGAQEADLLIATYCPDDYRLRVLTRMVLGSHEFPYPDPNDSLQSYEAKWHEKFSAWYQSVVPAHAIAADKILESLRAMAADCCFGVRPYSNNKMIWFSELKNFFSDQQFHKDLRARDMQEPSSKFLFREAAERKDTNFIKFLTEIGYQATCDDLYSALQETHNNLQTNDGTDLLVMGNLVCADATAAYPATNVYPYLLHAALRDGKKEEVLLLLKAVKGTDSSRSSSRPSLAMYFSHLQDLRKDKKSKHMATRTRAVNALKLLNDCLDELGIPRKNAPQVKSPRKQPVRKKPRIEEQR